MNPEKNISIIINFRRLIFFMGVMFRVLFFQFQLNLFIRISQILIKNLLGKADWLILKIYISYFYKYIQEHITHEIYNCKLNSFQAILNADTREEKMTVVKQEVYLWNSCSFHGTKLLKSAFNVKKLIL